MIRLAWEIIVISSVLLAWEMMHYRTQPPALVVPTVVHEAHAAPLRLVDVLFERYAGQARNAGGGMYDPIAVTYPFHAAMFRFGDGTGQAIKGMIQPHLAFPPSKECVVYGAGINGDSSFEESMATHCREVHAWDCTVDPGSPAVAGKHFTFHQECIGDGPQGLDATVNWREGEAVRRFAPLADIMKRLNHTRLDVLKMDIEGVEWAILEDIARGGLKVQQLMFEIHSECANPDIVPASLTRGRGREAVIAVFAALHSAGYRVASKEINGGDNCCAEFVLVHTDWLNS